jgi:hypothetical protein
MTGTLRDFVNFDITGYSFPAGCLRTATVPRAEFWREKVRGSSIFRQQRWHLTYQSSTGVAMRQLAAASVLVIYRNWKTSD